ncbi:hypothetical protein C2W62_38555 [Candidatus Entotheonella serta]|nr:hypothetical protein C2W62_38555 [Candidatus Entotheonella serta]
MHASKTLVALQSEAKGALSLKGDAQTPAALETGLIFNDSNKKVSKKGGVGGPVALASGYEYTYPLPNRPE